MKKVLISIVVFIVLGFGVWLLFNKPSSQAITEQPGTVEAAATTSPIVITALNKDVTLKETKLSRIQTIAKTATTTAGSQVKTSATGRALIESGAAHMTFLDYNSEITLTESSEAKKKTSIELTAGAVWSRLQKAFDAGEFYEIKTKNAVAVVQGTSFGLWYTGNTTTLIVTDGSVAFSARDTDTGETISGSQVTVTAGQKAVWNGMGVIQIGTITDKDRQSSWFIFNNPDSTGTLQGTSTQPTLQ